MRLLIWKILKFILGPGRCAVPEPKFDKEGRLVSYTDISEFEKAYGLTDEKPDKEIRVRPTPSEN